VAHTVGITGDAVSVRATRYAVMCVIAVTQCSGNGDATALPGRRQAIAGKSTCSAGIIRAGVRSHPRNIQHHNGWLA
jgi:hypothetical protein